MKQFFSPDNRNRQHRLRIPKRRETHEVKPHNCPGLLPGDTFRIVAWGGRAQQRTAVYLLKRQRAECRLPRQLEFSGQSTGEGCREGAPEI